MNNIKTKDMKTAMTNSGKIPESFKRRMYEDYKYNMKFFGKEEEILSYEVWLEEVLSTKI